MAECLVEVSNVSVKFNLQRKKIDSLKEYAIKAVTRRLENEDFWALSDISFTLERGEILGVMGPNGAGKSTLMRVIAGVLSPTLGEVRTYGTVNLFSLGMGFDADLTGNENIYLNGAMLGHSQAFMRERHAEILEFAELQEFADVPLKNYSTGMRSRLGFAIATLVQPDVLISDEGLATGDTAFQRKCNRKIRQMIDRGMSCVIVGHGSGGVKCSTGLLLDKGRMIQYGKLK